MSTLAIWCRVVHSRDVSPYIFDGPAMSGLAFSVPPYNVFETEQASVKIGITQNTHRQTPVNSLTTFNSNDLRHQNDMFRFSRIHVSARFLSLFSSSSARPCVVSPNRDPCVPSFHRNSCPTRCPAVACHPSQTSLLPFATVFLATQNTHRQTPVNSLTTFKGLGLYSAVITFH